MESEREIQDENKTKERTKEGRMSPSTERCISRAIYGPEQGPDVRGAVHVVHDVGRQRMSCPRDFGSKA